MKQFCFLTILIISATIASAQQTTTTLGNNDMFATGETSPDYGKVTIKQDRKLIDLVNQYVKYNNAQKGFAGWRVHIYFGSGYGAREKAEQIKTSFEEKHPDIPVYVEWKAPNFKVLVGDFRFSEKNEAYKVKKMLEGAYPNLWIESALINYPRLYETQAQDSLPTNGQE